MGFLNALLAGFAAAAAVPIIIHLLNQRRFKVVVWAAMDFLLATLEKNSRRLQLQDLILMMLRAGALMFLALALARPTLSPGGFDALSGQGETTAVIVLDNSMSMGHRIGNDSRFDAAKRTARAIIDHLPDGAGAALVLMSDVAIDEIPDPSHDLGFVASTIENAKLSDGGTDAAGGIAKAWEVLKRTPSLAKEIYVITDMQANSWPATGDAGWTALSNELNAAQPATRLYLATVSDDAANNLSIAALTPVDEQISTEHDTAFIATIQNHGSSTVQNVTVELLIGAPGSDINEPLRPAASVVVDRVDGATQVRLDTRFANGGDYRVAVRAAPDRLPADNQRVLSIPVVERMKVLVIDGEPSDGRSFAGAGDFISAALSPKDPNDDGNQALIQTDVVAVNAIGDRSLRDYHAIILANVGELPATFVEGLKTYVKADGRGLIIFGGENVQAQRYNDALGGKDGLLPGRLIQTIEADGSADGSFENNGDRGFSFATTDLGHPVVSFFSDKSTQPFITKPRFHRALGIEIDPADIANPEKTNEDGAVNIVARFTGNHPAIVERITGRGRVLVFASTANRDWTDLPLTPAFVMLTRRAVQHVCDNHRMPRNVQVNDPLIALMGAKNAGSQITVRDPLGQARTIAAVPTASGDLARVDYLDSRFAGFYHFTTSGTDAFTTIYAANPPRNESVLDALDEAGVRTRFPTLDFSWLDGRGEIGAAIDNKRVGREIWPLLFALACLCLIIESFLALRWAPKGA